LAAASAAELAETLDFRFVDGSAARMTRGEMLFHVVNHGSYHRGAVGNVLAQLGVAPPKERLHPLSASARLIKAGTDGDAESTIFEK
jgi:uncharacterized damage-inducible protein DinB